MARQSSVPSAHSFKSAQALSPCAWISSALKAYNNNHSITATLKSLPLSQTDQDQSVRPAHDISSQYQFTRLTKPLGQISGRMQKSKLLRMLGGKHPATQSPETLS